MTGRNTPSRMIYQSEVLIMLARQRRWWSVSRGYRRGHGRWAN